MSVIWGNRIVFTDPQNEIEEANKIKAMMEAKGINCNFIETDREISIEYSDVLWGIDPAKMEE